MSNKAFISVQGLAKLERGSSPNGATLARLQKDGGIRVTPDLVASFERDAA